MDKLICERHSIVVSRLLIFLEGMYLNSEANDCRVCGFEGYVKSVLKTNRSVFDD